MNENSPSNQDLKDLILNLEKQILAMDKKIDVQFTEVRSEIRQVEIKLEGQINRVEEKLEGQIKRVEEKLEGEIKRVEEKLEGQIKGVEEKLTIKIDGLGKRLDQQEFISRGAIITLIAGVSTGFIKYLFFPN